MKLHPIKRSQSRLPAAVRLYAALTTVAAVWLLLFWLQAWQGAIPTAAPALRLMALMLVLAVVAFHFHLRITPRYDLDMSTAVHFAALLLFGVPVAMLLVAASTFVGEMTRSVYRHARQGKALRSAYQVFFNTGQMTIAYGLGGAVYYALLPHQAPAPLERLENLWALPAAALTIYVAGSVLVTGIVSVQLKQRLVEVWLSVLRRDVLQEAALFVIGVVTALSSMHYPWAAGLLVLPSAVVYLSLKRTLQLVEQTMEAVEALADVIDRRDRYTSDHSKRVAAYAESVARALKLSAEQIETIRLAARVHDLGKIGVPDDVLLKPGKLTPEEWQQMEQHPEIGYEILSRFPEYRRGRDLVRAHHERFDGQGYPHRVAGAEIALGAQVIAVADTFDAMTTDRPYRRALSREEALVELRHGKGAQWAPQVVEAIEWVMAQQPAMMSHATAAASARPARPAPRPGVTRSAAA